MSSHKDEVLKYGGIIGLFVLLLFNFILKIKHFILN